MPASFVTTGGDDDWPAHDAAAAAALSAAVVGSEWGAAVPLGPAPWGHAHAVVVVAAAAASTTAAGAAPAAPAIDDGPHLMLSEPSPTEQLAVAVTRLEAALNAGGKGGGISSNSSGGGSGSSSGGGGLRLSLQQLQQHQQPRGRRLGTLGAGATAVPAASSSSAAAAAAAASDDGGIDGAAVAAFVRAATAVLLGLGVGGSGSGQEDDETEQGQGQGQVKEPAALVVKRQAWDRLFLLQSPSGDLSSPVLLSAEGESRLVAVCGALVGAREDAPEALVRSLLRCAVLPHLRALPGAASRPLVAALTGIAQRRPRLLVHEALLPLLCSRSYGGGGHAADDDDGVGSAQCEVVTRLVRQGALPPEHLDALLRGLCDDAPPPPRNTSASTRACCCEWTDLTLPVLTAVLLSSGSGGPATGTGTGTATLREETVLALLERVEGAVAAGGPLAGSLKLAALVNALVTRHAGHVRRFRPLAQRIADRCEGAQLVTTTAAATTTGGRRRPQQTGGQSSALSLITAALGKVVG